jgi:hypothetical protein
MRSAASYDPRLALARLALIEQEVRLASATRELNEMLKERSALPEPGDSWKAMQRKWERKASDAERLVKELGPLVGDPEAVVDEHGRLPFERRERFLDEFVHKINTEIHDLRERLPALYTELKVTRGRQARAPLREELRKRTARLAYLETLPPFTAPDMCSECQSPMSWHDTGATFCLITGEFLDYQCPAWPTFREQIRIGLERFAEMMRTTPQPANLASVVPQPLTLIPFGTSVEQTIKQLAAIQTDHPGAEVRRGKRNSWEIWPGQ